jgi:hypothetical protein
MARRFSRIKQAPKLQTAYDNFKLWQDRVEPYTPRANGSLPGGFVRLAITPFGLSATPKVIVGASRRANAQLGDDLVNRVDEDITGATGRGGYQPAKVTLFLGTGSSAPKTSEITRLDYQKRGGASFTHPFGASTATEREYEAFTAIAEALMTLSQNNRVSYTPEKVGGF